MPGRGWCELLVLLTWMFCKTVGKDSFATKDYLQKINTLIDIQISEKVMDYSFYHVFIHKKVNIEWSNLILHSYAKKVSIVLFHSDCDLTKFASFNRSKIHQAVGIFNDLSDVNILEWKNGIGDKWNPSAKFTVWIAGNGSSANLNYRNLSYLRSGSFRELFSSSIALESMHNFFQSFWTHNAVNVVLIVFNINSSNFDLFSFNPFSTVNNKRKIGNIYTVENNDIWFPDKFADLNGYPISISLFEKPPYVYLKNNNTELQSGEDVHFIRVLIEQMNFTLKLLSDNLSAENYHTKLPDGKDVGLIGDLLLNRSEMLGNSLYMYAVVGRDLQFLYPYNSGDYIAIVPTHPISSSLNVLDKTHFYLKTLIALIPAPFLSLYLYLRKERHPVFTTWHLVLHQQFLRIGSNTFDRIIRLTYIIFAIIVLCTFEGRLIKFLTAPRYNSVINTLKELDESNLTLVVGDNMFNALNHSNVLIKQRLAKKTITILNFTKCFENLLEYGNVACATDKYSAWLTIAHDRVTHEKFRVNVMKEAIGSFYTTYIIKKDLPYAIKFDLILRKLLESGIKVNAGKRSDSLILSKMKKSKFVKPKSLSLPIAHLEKTIYMYIFGLAISSLIFFVEFFFWWAF